MRITGGIHRSRTLRAPRGQATRPTSDRAREALFGLLDAARLVEGARVLDLYAGTGALGLEALSRGAAHATFVEHAADALASLRANVEALELGARARVVAARVERALPRLEGGAPFDLVLADPPWSLVDTGEAARALGCLAGARRLAPDAVVVLEHAARSTPPSVGGLALVDRRRYGDTALALYKVAILGPPASEPVNTPSG